LEPTFGTAEGIINLPEGAKFGEYTIALLVNDPPSGGDVALGGESFTMADPRSPTAELTLTAPAWVKPKDTVKVRLSTLKLGCMKWSNCSLIQARVCQVWATNASLDLMSEILNLQPPQSKDVMCAIWVI
jgi:hypothetical protein